ncbi:hypothetical protein AB4059_04805 [Lysobacter sp. 2RAF19]|jgi:hypothetical protein
MMSTKVALIALLALASTGCRHPRLEAWTGDDEAPTATGWCGRVMSGFVYSESSHNALRHSVWREGLFQFSVSGDGRSMVVQRVTRCGGKRVLEIIDPVHHEYRFSGSGGAWTVKLVWGEDDLDSYQVRGPDNYLRVISAPKTGVNGLNDAMPAIAGEARQIYLLGEDGRVLKVYLHDLDSNRARRLDIPFDDLLSLTDGASRNF